MIAVDVAGAAVGRVRLFYMKRDAPSLTKSPANGIRTLVVDNSPVAMRAIRSLVAMQLNLVFVGAATNGREALALARSLRPDLVLLDLEMPIMNGVETASYLARECPTARVVIVTLYDTPELRKLCQERGASGFIAKECLYEKLPIVVRELFGDGACRQTDNPNSG